MVTLYVDGAMVSTLADAKRLIPELVSRNKAVELRDDASGRRLGTFSPEPICPWEPDLTKEEIDRRCSRGGISLDEFWKRTGVK